MTTKTQATKDKAPKATQAPAKQARAAKAAEAAPPGPAAPKLSALDAAARVLAEAKEPLGCPDLIGRMAAAGLWRSPAGRTPAATLHAALMREINTKGEQSRFKKAGRGRFALAKLP